jgi:hypothetical protein
MNRDMFIKSILPIGILFSGSLILSNTAYLYLSVSYIQMLKVSPPFLPPAIFPSIICQAFTPVAILLISWASRIAEPNRKLGLIVLMISIGVALASHGELRFNLVGFITQAAAVAVRTFPFHQP